MHLNWCLDATTRVAGLPSIAEVAAVSPKGAEVMRRAMTALRDDLTEKLESGDTEG